MKQALTVGVILLLCFLALWKGQGDKGLEQATRQLVECLQTNEACAAWFGLEEGSQWG